MELAEDIARLSNVELHQLIRKTAECTHKHWADERQHVIAFLLFDLLMECRRERVRRCAHRAD